MNYTRVLVTGGAGFIGSHLVEELLNKGFRVRVLDDFSTGNIKNIESVKEKIEIYNGDVRDYRIVNESINGVDVVVHLAAKINVFESFKYPKLYNDVNVYGTLNLLNSCIKRGVKKFIYVSSCAVYGRPLKLPINEEHPTNPLSPYAASKLAAEVYCRAYANAHDLNIVILRLFNVYGPRQFNNPYGSVITNFINNLRKHKPPIIFGDGEQTRDFIYVSDVVEAITKILNMDLKFEIFNLGSGRAVSINWLAKTLMNIMGIKDLKPVYLDPRPGDIRHSQADIRKIMKIVNFRPKISIENGLRLMIKNGNNIM